MASRTPGILTVQECIQAMNTMNTFYDSSYSAPFVLVYKDKPEVRSVTSDVRASVLQDVSKTRSVLEMRLDFQDYLMTDYLLSKRALLLSSINVPNDDTNSAEEHNQMARGELRNGSNCHEASPSHMYQNFVVNTADITLSVKKVAEDVLPKKNKIKQKHVHSSSADVSARYAHPRREDKSMNSRSSAPQTSQTRPFVLRYTKR